MSRVDVQASEFTHSPIQAVRILAVCSVIAASVIAYLPAIDNFFISDDFTLLSYLRVLDSYPLKILEAPSEAFRVVSYVFFWICLQVFGLNSELWYASGIALHAVASLLVYAMVFSVTRHTGAAWAAALFFAAYERHQEAVMWISAFNDLILAVNCLLFLLLWEKALPGSRLVRGNYAAALLMFVVALFSKEAAVALFPLAVLRLVSRRYPLRQIVGYSLPLVVLLCGYVALWLSQSSKNFFVADGHYALGLHFVQVYARSIARLLAPALLLLAPLAFILYRRGPVAERELNSERAFSLIFFGAFLVLSILPYSFLTYLDHIPSRNTYLPSAALAGLIGVLFAMLYGELKTVGMKRASVAFLGVIVAGNVAYLWLKKDAQFRERSAPTRELLAAVNSLDAASINGKPLQICGFPLNSWIGERAIAEFTPIDPGNLLFAERCEEGIDGVALSWNEPAANYVVGTSTVTD